MIIKKYYKLVRVSHADSDFFRINNLSNEVGKFSLVKYSQHAGLPVPTLEYSLDGASWNSYDVQNTEEVDVLPGSAIYLRGTNNTKFAYSDGTFITAWYSVHFTKTYSVGGNIITLLDKTNYSTINTIDGNSGFGNFFKNETNLTDASNLNFGSVTTLPDGDTLGGTYGSLYGMFWGCTNLVSVPDVTGITSCGRTAMASMFYGCTSLEVGIDLSQLTSVRYWVASGMYTNCQKLKRAIAPNVQNLVNTACLNNWLSGAGTQATGTKTVSVPTGATINTDSDSGIPTGWTRVDY